MSMMALPRSLSFFLMVFASGLFVQPASAASIEALNAVRDAAVPGECDTAPNAADVLGPIRQRVLPNEGGVLYLVPCRTTAFDIVALAIRERDGRFDVLNFPDPGFDLSDGLEKARLTRMSVTNVVLSPQLSEDGTRLTVSARIPPGLASGVVVTSYTITGDAPELVEYSIALDNHDPILLWPLH